MIEMSEHDALGMHEYLHNVKEGGAEFHRLYNSFMEKYPMPTTEK
jgi:hypothetical protein